MAKIYFIFLALLLPPALRASLILDLPACLQKALKANPQLELVEQDLAAAKLLKKKASRSRFLPKLDLENMTSIAPDVEMGSSGFADDDTKNDWHHLGPFNRVKITALQPLFTFGKIENTIDAASSFAALNHKKVEQKKQEVASMVSKLYYTRVFIKEVNNIIEMGHKSIKKAISQLQKKLRKRKKGKSKYKESDLMQLQMFAIGLQNKELEVQELNSKTMVALKKLLSIAQDSSFDTEDDFLDPIEEDIQDQKFYLEKLSPDHLLLSQLSLGLEAKKALLKVAKASYLPQFFIAGQFEYATTPHRDNSTNPFLNDPLNRTQGAVALGFKLPLSFHLTSLNVQEKEVEVTKLKVQKQLAKDLLEVKTKEHYQKLLTAKKQMNNNEQLKILAKKWLNSEMINFDLQGTGSEDLLKALKSYLENSAKFLESILNFNHRYIELQLVAGDLSYN